MSPDSDNPEWPSEIEVPAHEEAYKNLRGYQRLHIPSERHLQRQADDFRRDEDQQKRDLIDSLRRRRNTIPYGYKEI